MDIADTTISEEQATAAALDALGDAPAWLDGIARDTWLRLADDLRQRSFIRASDEAALARYCDYIALWRDLRDQVRDKGATVTSVSKHGSLDRVGPAFKAMLALETALVALEDRYGLTPAARYSILAKKSAQGELPLEPASAAGLRTNQQPSGSVVNFPGIGAVAKRTG